MDTSQREAKKIRLGQRQESIDQIQVKQKAIKKKIRDAGVRDFERMNKEDVKLQNVIDNFLINELTPDETELFVETFKVSRDRINLTNVDFQSANAYSKKKIAALFALGSKDFLKRIEDSKYIYNILSKS